VLAESVAVLASPVIAFFVLRLRAMSPVDLPDPSMHTIYIVDPSQMFNRYAAAFAATARMREGAQAGFLVLARLAYLGFGILGGFFVMRYFLALVAVVPAYVLLRKLYGIPAAVVGVIVLLSCPVLITAWGTDYPDCAVVSYIAGAVCCLAMPARDRGRPLWLIAGGVLLTLATWSHGIGIVLAATTVVVYVLVRLMRARRRLVRDGALLVAVAVAATVILMFASRAVLGQFDFIRPTLAGEEFLNHPAQIARWHTPGHKWPQYVPYLLVPPSVIVAFWLSFARRLSKIASPQLFVGLVCTVQLAVFAYLQFVYHVQALEQHYFSSTLWGVVCLALALILAEMARSLSELSVARWLPAVLLVAVPLAYEADPHVPSFRWWPVGLALAAVPALLCALMRIFRSARVVHPAHRVALGLGLGLGLGVAFSIVGLTGSLLVLTVAPWGRIMVQDPPPAYASALGGSSTTLVDWYQVCADLPSFVGGPSYKGEQLLMWIQGDEIGSLLGPVGIFHAGFNLLPNGLPVLSAADAVKLENRRPAELLLLDLTGAGFARAFAILAPYRPVLLRAAVLQEGKAVLHAWLIGLRAFEPRAV
jgi:hypothetical protein